MLELATIVLTIGAMLYRTAGLAVGEVGYVAVLVTVVVSLIMRSRAGLLAGLILGSMMMVGAVALWRVDVPVDTAIYGKRAFDARVVSVDRRLDKTNVVVIDKQYDQKLQVSTTEKVEVLPGDHVTVRGSVEAPEDFVTDSGRIFGYEAYLASKGIVGLVRNAITGPVTEHDMVLARFPTRVRYAFADIFARYVSFPFDGVLAGMIVGYQGGLPDYISDLFRNTGVLHVLVLSGYNITLLAGFLALLLKGLPFKLRSLITALAILMLVLISGAGVASVRAGIMGGIAVFAGLSIKTYQPMRALWVSYLFFFFLSPTSIFVDPGFHLSFLATMFMIAVLPKVETLFHFIPKTNHIDLRELIMLAISAPVFMLPYMMYFSGSFPLSSPFANVLFALITPVIMISGILLIAISWITPAAALVGVLLSGLGSVVLGILRVFDRLYLWQTPSLAWWGVTAIYVVMLGLLFKRELREFLLQRYKVLRRRTSA
jgi:ComEC/Rec2-related protein